MDSKPLVFSDRKQLTIALTEEEHLALFDMAWRLSTSPTVLGYNAIKQFLLADKQGVRHFVPRTPLKEPPTFGLKLPENPEPEA